MPSSVSYRIDGALKARLVGQAGKEGVTETALVSRLLDEGLKAAAFPGVVYRGPAAARRAGLATGPDVWEVIVGLRHAKGQGERKIAEAAKQMSLTVREVRLALDFAAAHPDEIEARIDANEAAAEQVRRLTQARTKLLAS